MTHEHPKSCVTCRHRWQGVCNAPLPPWAQALVTPQMRQVAPYDGKECRVHWPKPAILGPGHDED